MLYEGAHDCGSMLYVLHMTAAQCSMYYTLLRLNALCITHDCGSMLYVLHMTAAQCSMYYT